MTILNCILISNLDGSVTSGAGAFFLGFLQRFLHKTLKNEQELVTYKKKVSGTKQVGILVLAGRFSNFLDNVKPYAR